MQTKLKQADDWVCAMIRKGLPQTFLPDWHTLSDCQQLLNSSFSHRLVGLTTRLANLVTLELQHAMYWQTLPGGSGTYVERALQSLAVCVAELGHRLVSMPVPCQHVCLILGYGRRPTVDRTSRDCLGPNSATLMLLEIAIRLYPLLRGPTQNELLPLMLPLRTFGLFDALLPTPADGVNWSLYALALDRLKEAQVIGFPEGP